MQKDLDAASSARLEPFFILGAPRSGTSLLSRMLNSHAAIAVPDETKVFDTFVPLQPLYGDLHQPDRLRRLVSDVLGWRWVRRLPHLPSCDAVVARVARPELGAVFQALFSLWAERQGKACWGEKTPRNIEFWSFIDAAFPGAAIIHIVRDGRDVALSQIKAPFGPKTVATAAERWVSYIRQIRAIGERAEPGLYVEIRYEDLLVHPRETITHALQPIGAPFDPAVLQFYLGAKPVDTDPVNDANIQRPLLVANTGKWKLAFNRRQIGVFEAIGGATLDACGYSRATTRMRMTSIERALRRYVEPLPSKALAMARNRSGIATNIERKRIRWRLIADKLRERLRSNVGRESKGSS